MTSKVLACSMNVKEVLENDPGAYFIHDELLAPLKVMYSSLQETGDDSIANARLLDCMRQVSPLHPLSSLHPLLGPLFLFTCANLKLSACTCSQMS